MTKTILTKARIAILRYLGGVDQATAQAETEWLENQLALKGEQVSRMHLQIEDLIDTRQERQIALTEALAEVTRQRRKVAEMVRDRSEAKSDYWRANTLRFRKLFEEERTAHERTRTVMHGDDDAKFRHLKEHFAFLNEALVAAERKLEDEYRMPLPLVDWNAERDDIRMVRSVTLDIKVEPLRIAYINSLADGLKRDMLVAEIGGYFHRAFEREVVPALWDNYRFAVASAVQKLTNS